MNIRFLPVCPTSFELARQILGIKWTEDTKGLLALDSTSGRVVAGCILNNWTWTAVMAHMWVDKPLVLRHGFLQEIYEYVFVKCGRKKMLALIRSDNEEAIRLDSHIGFKETYRIKDAVEQDVDWVLMEATEKDLERWDKNG